MYPRLKVLAFGAKPETTLHTYFPSFLSRATPNCPADMRNEVSAWRVGRAVGFVFVLGTAELGQRGGP